MEDELRKRKFAVWMDDKINFGSRWWKVIEEEIIDSKALVVLMSPNSSSSKWVEKEFMFADDERKPIFPLLLSGKRFPYFVNLQWIDVTDGQLPGQNFFEQLMQIPSSVPRVTGDQSGLKSSITIQKNPNIDEQIQDIRKLVSKKLQSNPIQTYKVNMSSGPRIREINTGIYYYGAYHALILTEQDRGRTLKITVDSMNLPVCWIELWRGSYDGGDIVGWTKRRVLIARSSKQAQPNPSLTWRIEPGSYTVYFVADNRTGIVNSENISYQIGVN